jgi:hypothetical protein
MEDREWRMEGGRLQGRFVAGTLRVPSSVSVPSLQVTGNRTIGSR